MSRVKGRTDDMIIIRGVNVFPSEMERELLKIDGLMPVYQIHLIRKGAMDAIELHVECETALYNVVGEDLQHDTITLLKRRIQHQMKSTCLISVDIIVNPPKTIPRSEGKAIRLIDKREKNPIGV